MKTKITKKEMINKIIEYTNQEIQSWFAVDNSGCGSVICENEKFIISYTYNGLKGEFYVNDWQNQTIDYVFSKWACEFNIKEDNRQIFTPVENNVLDRLRNILVKNLDQFDKKDGSWANACHKEIMTTFNISESNAFDILKLFVDEFTNENKEQTKKTKPKTKAKGKKTKLMQFQPKRRLKFK